jgi:CBS domain-containing protein
MKIHEIMTTKVLYETKESDSLASAAHRMAWAGRRHLPVTREHEVVGVLSERDILAWTGSGRGLDGPNDRVAAVMSTPPIVTVPDEELGESAARMIASRIDCLPVVTAGRLVGMVTSTDLLERLVTQTC